MNAESRPARRLPGNSFSRKASRHYGRRHLSGADGGLLTGPRLEVDLGPRTEGGAVKVGPLAAAEAQRILNGAARPLLDARLDGDAIRAAAGTDDDTVDHGNDEGAPLVKRQRIPIASIDRERGRRGRG